MKKTDKIVLGDDDLKSYPLIKKILEEMHLEQEIIHQFKGIPTLAFVIVSVVKYRLLPDLSFLDTELVEKVKHHPGLSALVKRIVVFRFSSTIFGTAMAYHQGVNAYFSQFITRPGLLTYLEHYQN